MAEIRTCAARILVSSGDCFAVLNLGKDEKKIEVTKIPTKDEIDEDGEKKIKQHNNNPKDDNRILTSACSPSGKFLAFGDDRKFLHLYETDGGVSTLISSRSVIRRCTSVVFSQDEKWIVVADKSGDVYRFSVQESGREGELLLGHLSMLLDLVLIKDDKYVVTADRDEKIRVSCFPNSYNIHSFCLGHSQFVSSLVYDEEDDFIISGSGDCSVRLWRDDGTEVFCQNCQCSDKLTGDESQRPYIRRIAFDRNNKIVAVCFGRSQNIEIYRLVSTNESTKLEFIHGLKTEGEVWDIGFDANTNLWLLQPLHDSYVQVYSLVNQAGKEKFEICSDEKMTSVVQEFNNLKDFFSASLQVEPIYPNLRKVCTDNMAEYLQRKEKRIKGEKLDPPNIPEKKTKLS